MIEAIFGPDPDADRPQFAPHTRYIVEAFDVLRARLPEDFIAANPFLRAYRDTYLWRGLARYPKSLLDQLPTFQHWPDLRGGCGFRIDEMYDPRLVYLAALARMTYNLGQHDRAIAARDLLPWTRYSAPDKLHASTAHLALDGRIFRADDPGLKTMLVQMPWSCGCSVGSMSERMLYARGLVTSSEPFPIQAFSTIVELPVNTIERKPASCFLDGSATFKPWGSEDAKCRMCGLATNAKQSKKPCKSCGTLIYIRTRGFDRAKVFLSPSEAVEVENEWETYWALKQYVDL